ncbi:MAG: hypothetical protein D6705_03460 [Deltaproteobacteria bacterium]|nr:MAG: hypothetical protein D6705_03460 [Deltaproteobacteria bacterium]
MSPVLFTIPGLDWQVQAYGFLLAVALVAGWFLALRLAHRAGLPVEPLGTVYVVGAAAGMLAARVGYLLQHPDRFTNWRDALILAPGGLAPFFGAVVALLVSAVMVGRRKIPVLRWFDCLALPYMVGVVLERIGAFLAGSGFGRYVEPTFPLAVRYPPGSPAYRFHRTRLDMLLPEGAEASLPVHPSQLYGALLGLVGVALAAWVWRRRRVDGQVFLSVSIYWLLARALVEEWFRADAVPGIFGPLAPGQLVAVVLAAALGAFLWVRLRGTTT